MKWSENFLIRKTIKLLHALETWHFLDLGEVCISLCKIVTLGATWNPSTASLPYNCLSSMLNYSYFINNEFLQWMLMPKKVNQQIEARVYSTLMNSNVNTPKDIIWCNFNSHEHNRFQGRTITLVIIIYNYLLHFELYSKIKMWIKLNLNFFVRKINFYKLNNKLNYC